MSDKNHFALAEKAIAALLIAWGLLHFAIFYLVMAPTSLWIDEIRSVRDFASQGLWTTLSTYPEPNNHIFYNALQSFVLNPEQLYDPQRARLLSFIFALGSILLVAVFLCRRQRFIEAGLSVLLLGSSVKLLSIVCAARGYGLQMLLITGLALTLWTSEQPQQKKNLWLAGALVVLVIWTAPSILLAIAPFGVLSIILTKPYKPILIMWVGAAAATMLVHAPVLAQFIEVYTTFSDTHGALFNGWQALAAISSDYFGDANLVALFIGLAIAFGCSLCTAKQKDASPAIWLGAFVAAVTLGWISDNPPPRVFTPLAAVVWLSAFISIGGMVRGLKRPTAQAGVATTAIAAVLLLIPRTRALGDYVYHPMENWLGVAEFIELAYPPGTPVWCSSRPELLDLYLPDAYPLLDSFDEARYRGGALVVVDTKMPPTQPLPTAVFSGTIMVPIPQVREREQSIYLTLPSPLATAASRDQPGFAIKQTDAKQPVHALLHIGDASLFKESLVVENDRSLTPTDNLVWRYSGIEVIVVRRPILGLAVPGELANEPVCAIFALPSKQPQLCSEE